MLIILRKIATQIIKLILFLILTMFLRFKLLGLIFLVFTKSETALFLTCSCLILSKSEARFLTKFHQNPPIRLGCSASTHTHTFRYTLPRFQCNRLNIKSVVLVARLAASVNVASFTCLFFGGQKIACFLGG